MRKGSSEMVVLIHPKLEARTLAQRGLEYSTIHKEVASYKPPHTKYPLRPFTEILLSYAHYESPAGAPR